MEIYIILEIIKVDDHAFYIRQGLCKTKFLVFGNISGFVNLNTLRLYNTF